MKELKESLKVARKHLKRVAKQIPNQDAYATVYSILSDLAAAIDRGVKDIGPACTEAKRAVKKNPEQAANRAKKWCSAP